MLYKPPAEAVVTRSDIKKAAPEKLLNTQENTGDQVSLLLEL